MAEIWEHWGGVLVVSAVGLPFATLAAQPSRAWWRSRSGDARASVAPVP
jgi:hypothetical protein